MKVSSVPIGQVFPYARNPRKNEAAVEKVAASIKEFGWRQPIVVDEKGVIIAGHTRLLSAQRLGMAEVPVHVAVGLSEAQAKAYRLMDNRSGQEAEWDMNLLPLEFADLMEMKFDLKFTGFETGEIEGMFGTGTAGLTDPDEAPELPADPVTRPGDLIILGNHRLLCGDATKAEDAARLMQAGRQAGRQADMVLTDPPYGVSYVGKTKDALTIESDDMDEAALSRLISGAFDRAQENSRPGAYWYATVPAGPLHLLFALDWKVRGILRQIMVWAKDSMVLGHSEYHYRHEPILFGWIPGERHKNTDRTRTTLWEIPRPKRSTEHPTMKPIELWARAINDGSRAGEVVYDPFLGSGTTIIAAEMTGRVCHGLEIDPKYCDVIVQRWETFTGMKAERIDGGQRENSESEKDIS